MRISDWSSDVCSSDLDRPMPQEPAQPMDHAAMGHEGMIMAPTEPITPIPALTEADRIAAVPPPGGHAVHDNAIQSFVLIDRLETWDADSGTGLERSEEHTSDVQSLMRISHAVLCLKKKKE